MHMFREKIKSVIYDLTNHHHLEITTRGNAAISAALSLIERGQTLLIPEEGGWLHYRIAPPKLGLKVLEVRCDDAKINLKDLQEKLANKPRAFLYQNPGGYFAEQPLREIYQLCRKQGCLVFVDVSGALGTRLCDGRYADVLVGSFGKGKLVEAGVGGFVSCKKEKLFEKMKLGEVVLNDDQKLRVVLEKLNELPGRIKFLEEKRRAVLRSLRGMDLVHPLDLGFVVVVRHSSEKEKEKVINYCENHHLKWTEGPRYVRLNSKAVSIEIKREVKK